MKQIIFITGGSGFIGSALIRFLINNTNHTLINIDKLTYAGNLRSLNSISSNPRYFFEQLDINDRKRMRALFHKYKPNSVMHLAAESHVDRSISSPDEFIKSNILGTYSLLEESRIYFDSLSITKKMKFRFHHISTDEVYGDLGDAGFFKETTAYNPSSPYSASKAASDHLVRAWNRTYDLPTLITNCSNNYGPFQYPEKLIPLIINNALNGKKLPIYGNGTQIRDWLYVEDHVKALYLVLTKAKIGETYNIGGNNEVMNIDLVCMLCNLLEELAPDNEYSLSKGGVGFKSLIKHVADRPGHDTRYAIDASKINTELGWQPNETFESGLKKTVIWFLDKDNYSNHKNTPN